MSEQNILNPTVGDNLNPDYGYSEGLPNMMSQFQAKSGKVTARQMLARGRVYDLQWLARPKATADALRTWEAQYRNDFFSYQDIERGRYFSGRFAGPPRISPAGFNKWNIQAQFVEIPGLPMFAYPAGALWTSNGGTESIFMEERDGFGNNLVKLTGSSWSTIEVLAPAHGGSDYFTNGTNDTAEWVYFGYGVRLWSRTSSQLGKVELSWDGNFISIIDLYSLIGTASIVVAELASPGFGLTFGLGLHRVKLRCTGTKNAASSNFFVYADAIEVMQ